ncbi:DUF559 domain-containing protein [Marmoricola endophyticus]|uniref:DUF559 domain-containing protein n=1 Tax=Marmoricola endophyticus TaxID=2040280 RepID=UPI0016687E88|nr:DUF559 domain-containing protein [Marmoricola endophyticus]
MESRAESLLTLRAMYGTQPFTAADAVRLDLGPQQLTALCRQAELRRLLRGVYVDSRADDSLQTRLAALKLVIPAGVVVTDRTAAWLHGADMALEPGAHLAVPPISVFHRSRGGRLRNDVTRSGQRMMPDSDVVELDGLLVTTPLRTALDLGRLLPRSQAFAGMDQMLGLGVPHQDLVAGVERFRTRRGVRQLRTLAPLADPRAESPGESALRLHWLDACPPLPRPQLQVVVPGPNGEPFRLDLADERSRFAAEYDGEAWHGADRETYDRWRREWLRRMGWTVLVFRRSQVFGQRRDAELMLRRAWIGLRGAA